MVVSLGLLVCRVACCSRFCLVDCVILWIWVGLVMGFRGLIVLWFFCYLLGLNWCCYRRGVCWVHWFLLWV